MSKANVLSVRDSKVSSFSQPFFVPSIAFGLRSFSDEVNRADGNNQLHKHPEDFELYHIGYFDDETGLFESQVPERLARAIDLVNPSN